MRLLEYVKCVVVHREHAWVKSQKRPGYMTCRRCFTRKPIESEGRAV